MAIRATPDCWNRSIASSFRSSVALGVMVVRSPRETLFLRRGKRSGLFNGSPPVNTISGSPKARTVSSRWNPSSVFSSKELRAGIAHARQCTQASVKNLSFLRSRLTFQSSLEEKTAVDDSATSSAAPLHHRSWVGKSPRLRGARTPDLVSLPRRSRIPLGSSAR